jgi:hypothetical protein
MKDSSFVQEVENRFDALFDIDGDSADRNRDIGHYHVNTRDILEGIAAESTEVAGQDMSATKVSGMDDHLNGNAESASPVQDGRYHILLEENEKETNKDSSSADHPSLDEIVSGAESPKAGVVNGKRFERRFGDIASFTPAFFSPIKNLKSILLSLEWEISDVLLNNLDEELNGLQDRYRNERTVLVFLRILQFMERYIKVKRGDSHVESIKLLFSVYDDFERIILSKTMSDEIKRAILEVDIVKYRNWIENMGLSGWSGADVEWNVVPAVATPEALPSDEIEVKRSDDRFENAGSDPCTVIKVMEPHEAEAFAYALVEFKKTIHTEFEALRAEIRMYGARKVHPQAGNYD